MKWNSFLNIEWSGENRGKGLKCEKREEWAERVSENVVK
jgi:hypothetical protein